MVMFDSMLMGKQYPNGGKQKQKPDTVKGSLLDMLHAHNELLHLDKQKQKVSEPIPIEIKERESLLWMTRSQAKSST